MLALCLKCYFVEEVQGEKHKLSSKSMSKAQNKATWGRLKATLKGSKDMAMNRRFCMRDGRIMT